MHCPSQYTHKEFLLHVANTKQTMCERFRKEQTWGQRLMAFPESTYTQNYKQGNIFFFWLFLIVPQGLELGPVIFDIY